MNTTASLELIDRRLPLINEEQPDGSIKRTLAIGLLPKVDANSTD